MTSGESSHVTRIAEGRPIRRKLVEGRLRDEIMGAVGLVHLLASARGIQ